MTTIRVAIRKFAPFESAIARQFADFTRSSGTEARLEIEALDLNPLHESLFARRGLLPLECDPGPDGRLIHFIFRGLS